jgi:hypothetical protein
MSLRVSLAELASANIHLRPAEAVAIVAELCRQYSSGRIRGIPSPGVIRLSRDGALIVEGPITTAQDNVARAAHLLTDLLPSFDALPEYRVSGALRLVIARAMGTIDLPPYASLDDFCAALSRFATDEVNEVARGLFNAWERASLTRAFKAAPRADLTISDVRRARRATGLSLGHLAAVAEVPSTRLCDLEWGYMRDWPATAEARAQVIRYARAAGLDESIVLSIAWPMIIEHAGVDPQAATSTALVPASPQTLTVIHPPARPKSRGRRAALVGAAAAIALLGAFVLGSRSSGARPTSDPGVKHVEAPVVEPAPVASTGRDESAAVVSGEHDAARSMSGERGVPRVVPASATPSRAAVPAGPSATKAKRRRAAPPRPQPREEPRKSSVFERELFRIVIR